MDGKNSSNVIIIAARNLFVNEAKTKIVKKLSTNVSEEEPVVKRVKKKKTSRNRKKRRHHQRCSLGVCVRSILHRKLLVRFLF